MTDPSNLMSIGRFSSLSRISVRMLRHYDASGVLIPAVVDNITGYRWYSPRQLREASRIRQLRDVGFGVSAIGALLAVYGTPAYTEALRSQRLALVDESAAARHRLTLIEHLLDRNTLEHTMTDVKLIDIPAQTLVTLRGTLANYAAEGELWARFMPELQRQHISIIGPGGCIEHDAEFRESDVDESVFVETTPGTEVQSPLIALHLPARRAVSATVKGPFAQVIPQAHDQIAAFIDDNGLRISRTDDLSTHHFNIYLNDPSQVPESEAETSVIVPVI
ncbi:MerR family transcriptional regulator [Nocardia sp. NEAU-G5]|uniref:MerR family transcriptional regulator n=1 Tax=Nocardia albiluteola TaxID=2842303 RepID=A0ABS6AX83_9NOCA|nr:MerR family transcriptional regulator [Nocardia albiluteola]MBU3062674.1 MerR family transcriptional regulator [Nocardia albiluteola]MBU3065492.1 MerR family transcriptional regulator [Nocardia albiluteola]